MTDQAQTAKPATIKKDVLPAMDVTGDPRESKFIEYLSIYTNPVTAAKKAGYSDTYSLNISCNKLKSQRFLNKLKAHYNGRAAALLPALQKVESKAVQYCMENPQELPKFRHTLKEIKQTAGVLAPDITTNTPTVQINGVQNLMLQIQAEKEQGAEE